MDEALTPAVNVPQRKFDARLIAAVAAVWLFWGSTFAGMRFAVQTIPPFAMASIRFTVAGAVLYAVCVLRRRARIRAADLQRAAVTGGTLLLLGNGMTAWTVQYLPTGLNSLLLSLAPVWMAVIAFLWNRERPTRLAMAGMLLGFAGLALLLLGPSAAHGFSVWPATLAVLASIAWAFGSVYARNAGRVAELMLATALQMLAGGVGIGIEAALFGEWHALNVHAVSAASLGGLVWLIVFGSLVGYSAFLFMMQNASIALSSTYAYVNPIVAVILGVVVFHERFTPLEAVAGAIIVCGVALMMIRPSTFRRRPESYTGGGLRSYPR